MKSFLTTRILPVAFLLVSSFPAGAVSVDFGTLAVTNTLDISSGALVEDSRTDGGAGIGSAFSEYVVPDPSNPPDGEKTLATASAEYDGTKAFTPSLGVMVDNLDSPFFAVGASASGIQSYQNIGPDPLNIDLDYTLDITAQQGAPGLLMQIVLYRTDAIEITGDPNDIGTIVVDFGDPDLIDSISYPFPDTDLSGTFSFTIAPNEDFLIWAGLNVFGSAGDFIDASNTLGFDMTVNGVLNDTSSLQIASQNVGVIPLPAGVWLFLTGVGLVAGLSRRRKALPAS